MLWTVYKDLIISTIVDYSCPPPQDVYVYKDLIISTIVDGEFDEIGTEFVYKDLIISTIVDNCKADTYGYFSL